MVVCRKPLILGTDLVGLVCAAALGAAVVLGVIQPVQRDYRDLPRVRTAIAAANESAQGAYARNQATDRALQNLAASLREEADLPLADMGTFLEHMSERCRRHSVRLQQVDPQPVSAAGGFKSWAVQVRAQGTFPDFQRLLADIESWSPFVQVSELTIQRLAQSPGSDCDLAWTVRVNYLPRPATDAPRPPESQP